MTRKQAGMTATRLSLIPFSLFGGGMEEKIDIEAISRRHIYSIDKLYRMHGGLSSDLVSYDSGVIELEIRKGKRWPKPPELKARQLAECWKSSNRELSNAVAFIVHIDEHKAPTGFSVPADLLKNKDAISALAESIRQTINAPRADILIATVRGRFDHPRPTSS